MTTVLTKEQAKAKLGVAERQLQLLVKLGRVSKVIAPGSPNGGPKPRNHGYTLDSIDAELRSRQIRTAPPVALAQIQGALIAARKESKVEVLPAHSFMSLKEAADELRMPLSWVREKVVEGQLPAEKTGRGFRVARGQLSVFGERAVCR